MGSIVTIPTGFVVYKNNRFYKQIDCVAGADSHIDEVKRIAKKCFGNGRLRKLESTELPCDAFTKWGFTERVGEVSVRVTNYAVL
jgi:hypothetical protein